MTDQVTRWADGIQAGTVVPDDIPQRERDSVQIELLRRAQIRANVARAEKLGKAS